MFEKLAILCSDDAHHEYMIALMRSQLRVALVIREPGREQRKRARIERRWKDYFYGQYHHLRRSILGLNAYRRKYFTIISPMGSAASGEELWVECINQPIVAESLYRAQPDLTIVMGTSIIKKNALQAAGPNIINIHGGYLPYFRGNHCFFFALYHREFDKIGSTIHFVNEGIDTGDIIAKIVPMIGPEDNAEALYCRAEKMAIHHLAKLIGAAREGKDLPRARQPFRGRLYLTRDRKPWHDLHHWIRCMNGSHARAVGNWNKQRPSTFAELESEVELNSVCDH